MKDSKKLPAGTTSKFGTVCGSIGFQQAINTHLLGPPDICAPETVPNIDEEHIDCNPVVSGMSRPPMNDLYLTCDQGSRSAVFESRLQLARVLGLHQRSMYQYCCILGLRYSL